MLKFLIVLFILGLILCYNFGYSQANRPNIILIISDDQGYYDFGSYGNEEV